MNVRTLFDSICQAIPVPVLLIEANAPDFTIISASNMFCEAIGIDANALEGQPVSVIFPDGRPDGVSGISNLRTCIMQTIKTGQVQRFGNQRQEIKNPDTHTLELRYWDTVSTPIFDDITGKIAYVLNTTTDITQEHWLKVRTEEAERDRNESQKQLESAQEEKTVSDESNALLHAIIDAAQAGIFLLSPVCDAIGNIIDFRFRMANRMLATYFGQTPDMIGGSLVSRWLPGYFANGLFERFRQAAERGAASRFEFHYDTDGMDIWLDVMCTRVNDEVLVTFTDHTAMKNLQRRLEEHVAELRSSNANLEQFAYIASHDLQEPLRKVKSFGDMLQSRYQDVIGAGGADLIARMQSAAARMATLIDDLLTYSRASVKPAERNIVNTDKVLEGAILDLERAIQQQKAVIRKDRLLPVAGKETQIGQVFLNLLSNALKFHKPGRPPEIIISSEVVKGKDSGLSVNSADADRVFQLIRISDNGIGFENAYRDHIFQIFHRLNNKSDYPGSGVGLSIVKKVIENHDGYIEANSEPGKGTTFFILLPLAEGGIYRA